MANDYTSSSDVKSQMPESVLSTSTDYDDQIGILVTAASRMIDNEVGRWPGFFYPTTDDETRYFDGNNEVELDIDPLVSLTSVSVAEEGGTSSSDYTAWTLNTDYYTWPYNSTGTGEPITRLIVDWNGDQLNWTHFRKAVMVTGVFGYSAAAPAVIRHACEIQVMRWLMRSKQGYQDAGASPEVGQLTYVKRLDPDVKELLWPFMIGGR